MSGESLSIKVNFKTKMNTAIKGTGKRTIIKIAVIKVTVKSMEKGKIGRRRNVL